MNTNPQNQEQIDRMRSFINQDGNTALTVLFELQNTKKEQSSALNESIRKYHRILLESILENLISKIPNNNLCNFLQIPTFYKEKRHEPLLEFLVGSTLQTDIDSDGCPFILIGSSLTNVKYEDMIPFSSSFKDAEEKCKYINSLWDGLAEISCHNNSLEERGLISFGFNASAFVHAPKVAIAE